MLDLFQIGVVGTVDDNCGGLEPIVRIIKSSGIPSSVGIFPKCFTPLES